MSTDAMTAAIARIWIVCTDGTTHPAPWIAWLSGVSSSQVQNLSSAGVRIELRRVLPMTGCAGVVDAPPGGKHRIGVFRLRRFERFFCGIDQSPSRLHPSV